MNRMPSNSKVVRFQASQLSAGSACVEDPVPRKYIIITSLYLSQRYCRKPVSGVHPCGRMRVSSESQFQSTRLNISVASSLISVCSKCSLQVRSPHNRIAVSTDDTSESQIRSPVLMFAQW